MSRYILIHRLRGPVILLLIGVLGLLYQVGAIAHFWRLFWPLLLILVGVLLLAERAALSAEGYPFFGCGPGQGIPHPGAGNLGTGNTGAGQDVQQSAGTTSTSIVPAHDLGPAHDFGKDPTEKDLNGGQP